MTQNFLKQSLYNSRISESETIDASRIRNHLRITGCNIPILHFPEVDSTNLEVPRQLDMGRSPPFAILASKQQSGRGRLGRRWHSPEEGNCYLSFAFTPDAAPDKLQKLTCWIGLEICRLLRDECKIPVHMKWPNDLKVGHRKIGGMLCESRTEGGKLLYLVFGVGINVNCRCSQWPPPIKEIATSLAEEAGKQLALNHFIAMLVIRVIQAWQQFGTGELSETDPLCL